MSEPVTEEAITTLRHAGRYEEAADRARALVLAREREGAAPWAVEDARRLIATCESFASVPADVRSALAEADRLATACESHYLADRWEAAVEAAASCVAILERHLDPGHLELGHALDALGLTRQDAGDLRGAEEPTRRGLEIRQRILGDAHPAVADSLNNLSRLHWMLGDFPAADRLLREALATWRRAFGDHERVALGLHNLARLHHDQGDLATAEPLYRAALALRATVSNPAQIMITLYCLSDVLVEQGDPARAVPLLDEALAMSRARGEDAGRLYPVVLTARGKMFQAQGDLEAAEDAHREALERWREVLEPAHHDLATGVYNYGRALLLCGRPDDALPVLEEALDLRCAALGAAHAENAFIHATLGRALMHRSAEAAARHLRAAVELADGPFRLHKVAFVSRVDLSRALVAQGRIDEAVAELRAAAERFEAVRLRAGHGLERATFTHGPYPALAAACLLRRDADHEAWVAMERSLGRILADLLVGGSGRLLEDSERERETALGREMARLRTDVSVLGAAAARDADAAARLADVRRRLLEAQAEWGTFQSDLAEKYALAHGRPFELARVQAALADRTAILGWLDERPDGRRPRAWAYVIRAEGPVTWVPLDVGGGTTGNDPAGDDSAGDDAAGDDIAGDDTVEVTSAWRAHLAAGASSPLGPVGVRDDPHAVALERRRLAPVAEHLAETDHLVVVSSGVMAGLPVEALVDAQGRALADRVTTSYVPSATLYAWLAEAGSETMRVPDARAVSPGRPTALFIGDPPFREAHRSAIGEGDGGDTLTRQAERAYLDALPRLAGAREEIEAARRWFADSHVLVGEAASERAITTLAESGELERFDAIHLATHAIVNTTRPDLSTLVLSQLDLPDPLPALLAGERVYRGTVTAGDIVREWHLSADLVTLSACSTGLGRSVSGEGFVGFVHAFLQVGARSVLASLWNVDDRATSLFMSRFYELRYGPAGLGKAAALREARRRVREHVDASGDRPYRDPAYWSAFVLFGDPA